MTEIIETEVDVEVEPPACEACDEPCEDGVVEVGGVPWCDDCATYCNGCGVGCDRDEGGEVNTWVHDPTTNTMTIEPRWTCDDCSTVCAGCSTRVLRTDVISVDLEPFCEECTHWCEECDLYYVGDYCLGSHEFVSGPGIRSYSRTVPTMWLGGPVADKGGYYIGFELEITASGGVSAEPVYEWASRHLGSTGAIDCKEDSSVEGFEIVTQPMTPEFFERVDWDSFFDMLNSYYPLRGDEPDAHGLHVHIGRRAFRETPDGPNDDLMTAAYAYLLSKDNHLDRIARRDPTGYCEKLPHPVKTVVVSTKIGRQATRIRRQGGAYAIRGAVNLTNEHTIEIRAFRSTRHAQHLKDAVRVTHLAADYVRALRAEGRFGPTALHWSEFAIWVAANHPAGFASIAGVDHHDEDYVEFVRWLALNRPERFRKVTGLTREVKSKPPAYPVGDVARQAAIPF